jgi:uncharacterized protein YaaR (DUF327 family)
MPDSIDNVKRNRRSFNSTIKSAGSAKKAPPDTAEISEVPDRVVFNEVLAGVTGRPSEKKLEALLNEIKKLADLLHHRRLLEDLEQYRRKVGDFLKLYLDEVLDVREASGRRGVSRRKQMIVVKRVNIELDELGRMILSGSPDFKILKELGTIEGLLMDLYR